MTAEDTLTFITNLFINYLDELNKIQRTDFILGEMTAYVETLEIIQSCNIAKPCRLNFNIADKYNI